MKKVTAVQRKKRGASADRTAELAKQVKYGISTSAIPAAELALHVDPNKPLTEKAKLFVKYWAQGESIISASARAGYGDGATYAYRVTRFPQAIALYEKEKAEYEASVRMTKKRVMEGFLESIEIAKLMAEPSSMVSGWREIARMCGYYEPIRIKHDVNHTGRVVMERLNQLSDAELLNYIANPNGAHSGDDCFEPAGG